MRQGLSQRPSQELRNNEALEESGSEVEEHFHFCFFQFLYVSCNSVW